MQAGCGEDAPGNRRNLLIVSFDTIRADRLGAYGNDEWGVSPSPHVDALAAEGVTFDLCLAPRGQTHPSMASLMTGRFPITHTVRENSHSLPPSEPHLFEELQAAGYRTGTFVANFNLASPHHRWLFRGADEVGDGYQGNFRTEAAAEAYFQRHWDDRVEADAQRFLAAHDDDRPFALFVHFYDCHKPYNPPPEQQGLYVPDDPAVPALLRRPGADEAAALEDHLTEITLGDRDVPAAELAAIRALYDATVTATDLRLGRLLATLSERGLDDDTVVVFTGDHGEELYDHNRYLFHGASIYHGTTRIPLVVRAPDLPAGARLSPAVQNVDLGPTVLDLLGLPSPTPMEGRSLGPLMRGETAHAPRPHAFVEWQDYLYSVTDGRFVYIDNRFHVHPRKSPYFRDMDSSFPDGPAGFEVDCFEAYDLSDDPGQQRDLLAGLTPRQVLAGEGVPDEVRALQAALDAWLRDPAHRKEFRDTSTPEQIEMLIQLGYVDGGSERADAHRAEPCVESR